MEVRKGFKQTEVGFIPEDWDVVQLGRLLKRAPTYGINAPAIPYDSRFPTYLRITDIDEDGRFVESSKVSVNHAMSSSYLMENGDLAFARTGASVGKSYLYNTKDGQLVFAGFLIRVSPDHNRLLSTYLKYIVQSKTYWNWIKTNSMRSGQPGINGREYASLPIPLPPTLAEQESIAEALSDADALIESLETLLAKKRQVKQGAMSELLSGKRRVVESGEWKVKRLGDVLTLRYGKSQKGIISAGGKYPIIATSGEVGRTNQYLYDKPSVIIGRKGTIDEPRYIDTPFWTIDTAYYSEISSHANPKFLYYLLNTFDWYSYNEASGVPSLNAKTVESIEIRLPELSEQTAIAEILSDMDAEIRAVEEKLSKARAVKAGMMSALLTGRMRLV